MPHQTDFTSARESGVSPRTPEQRSNSLHHARAFDVERDKPIGAGHDVSRDWPRIGAFGAGLALGLALGAGAALLFAPRTGEETRELLGTRARELGDGMADRWDDLRHELRRAARRGRRKMRRGVTRGRWALEDVRDRY
jgi:hypothetical protein